MAYSHSFSGEFYGNPYAKEYRCKMRRPDTVCNALASMNKRDWNRMARDVFGVKGDMLDLDVVLMKIQETDTVSNLDPPVWVWIDDEGWWKVPVYEARPPGDD